MDTSAFLFDRDALLAGLAGLDEVLLSKGQPRQDLIIVGGSYLALAELRQATRDVDTVTHLSTATRQAVDEVAASLGFPPGWLNDNAAQFIPAGLTTHHCTTVFEGTVLAALAPSADWIFLMKLEASRVVDRVDMIRLWPQTGFPSPAVAVQRYIDAYPQAPDDPYLEDFIATEIATKAG